MMKKILKEHQKLLIIASLIITLIIGIACGFVLGKAGTVKKSTYQNLRKNYDDLVEETNSANETDNAKSEQSELAIELIEQRKEENPDSDYIESYFTVKNNTKTNIDTLTLNIKMLDENDNIIETTHPQENVTVLPGQCITISALSKSNVYAMQLDSYSYYVDGDSSKYVQGDFVTDTPKLMLK